jgi:uncharacterized protein YraI
MALIALILLLPLAALASDVTVYAGTTVNVRSGPGTDYSIIGRLFDGESAEVNGRNSTDNSWLRIDFDGSEGWVAASVVSVEGDPTTLEIVEASNAEATVGNSGVTATTYEPTNVRVGPGTNYPAFGAADASTTFDVTGYTGIEFPLVCRGSRVVDPLEGDREENVWLQINYNGFDGWVAYTVVSVSGDLCSLSEVTADRADDETQETIAEILGSVVVVTLDNANLRETNYPTSSVLDVVPYGTTLVAEARDNDSARIRVTYEDQTGWISTSVIEVLNGDVDQLSVEQE